MLSSIECETVWKKPSDDMLNETNHIYDFTKEKHKGQWSEI